jgi:stage II sporulation protein D
MRRRLRTAALVALPFCAAALAGASAASAQADREPMATVYTFTGRGWGHGVGMSQYGARGQALAGRGAAAILRHYYRGTRLTTARARTVKVLLAQGVASVALSSPRRWRAVGAAAGGRGHRSVRLAGRAVVGVRPGAGGRTVLLRGARRVATFAGGVRLVPARGGSVAWGEGAPRADQRYRGELRAVASGGDLDVVNAVGLEDYLKGVVPREMPPDWGDAAPAALQVQAVAARSYALATMTPGAVYDLFDDDRSQTYGGVASEDPRSSRAVDATRSTVLTYGGTVIRAYFFSTSGGRTENVENVFGGSPSRPYLVSVPDPYDRGSPYHASWPDPPSFTGAGLGRAIGLDGPVDRVEILGRGVSPRVRSARFTARSGESAVLTGIQVRSALGLRDSWFRVTRRTMPRSAADRLVGGA